MRNLPVRMAHWSARHPWRAITGWFAFVVVCLGVGIMVGNNPATTDDFWVGEAGRAEAMATEGGLQRKPIEHVIIHAGSRSLDVAAARFAAEDLTGRMRALPEVDSVAAPVLSRDGKVLRVSVVLRGTEMEGRENVGSVLAQTAQVADGHPDLVIEETGSPSISKGVNDQRGKDLALAERVTLPERRNANASPG
jgi:putative drug exporter of the RND superfamily